MAVLLISTEYRFQKKSVEFVWRGALDRLKRKVSTACRFGRKKKRTTVPLSLRRREANYFYGIPPRRKSRLHHETVSFTGDLEPNRILFVDSRAELCML